jgi:AcrR family transcriptional regulator
MTTQRAGPPPPTAPRAEQTRVLLLLTAERLFAERGIESVSLREIAAAARQRNHFAVQYHFKSKEALVGEILAFRRVGVNQRRRELLAAIPSGGGRRVTRAAVEGLVVPLAETLGDPGSHFLRLMREVYAPRGGHSLAGKAGFRPLHAEHWSSEPGVALVNVIVASLDHLDAETVGLRLDLALVLMLGALAEREDLERSGNLALPRRERFVAELLSAMTAVLVYPSPNSRRQHS